MGASMTVKVPQSEGLAHETLDAAREELAVLSGMPNSGDPLIAQIHKALDKTNEALSWTLSALAEQRRCIYEQPPRAAGKGARR
jgi:hypothetical protein